jgi:hypothetical protein
LLIEHQVPSEHISMIALDQEAAAAPAAVPSGIPSLHSEHVLTEDSVSRERGRYILKKSTDGSILGGAVGLLIGVSSLFIPGVGPVVVAGPLAASVGGVVFGSLTAVTGAGTGALSGAFVGALKSENIAEHEAHSYVDWIQRGGTLLLVRTEEEREAEVHTLLKEAGAVDSHEAQWHALDKRAMVAPANLDTQPAWHDTSKAGTTAGAAAGAAVGAAVGSVAGPVGTVGGGAAGAAAGAAVGSVGDVGGKQLEKQHAQAPQDVQQDSQKDAQQKDAFGEEPDEEHQHDEKDEQGR